MEQNKSCSWNIKTHYLHFKHFIITITDDPSLAEKYMLFKGSNSILECNFHKIKIHVSEHFEFRHFRPHYLDIDTIFGDLRRECLHQPLASKRAFRVLLLELHSYQYIKTNIQVNVFSTRSCISINVDTCTYWKKIILWGNK
jgi:hypothetical protein